MNEREKAKIRNKIFMQVIDRLNKSGEMQTNIFDCGEVGFLEVYYRGTWHDRWIEVRDLKEFLKNNKPESGMRDGPKGG